MEVREISSGEKERALVVEVRGSRGDRDLGPLPSSRGER